MKLERNFHFPMIIRQASKNLPFFLSSSKQSADAIFSFCLNIDKNFFIIIIIIIILSDHQYSLSLFIPLLTLQQNRGGGETAQGI